MLEASGDAKLPRPGGGMPYIPKSPCVYILASARNGTLYIGLTSDLHLRMSQHKQGLFEGFTK